MKGVVAAGGLRGAVELEGRVQAGRRRALERETVAWQAASWGRKELLEENSLDQGGVKGHTEL